MARNHNYDSEFSDTYEPNYIIPNEQGFIALTEAGIHFGGYGTCENYSIILDKNNDRTIPDHIFRIEQNAMRVAPLISLYISFSNVQDPIDFKSLLRNKINEYNEMAYGGSSVKKQTQKAMDESSRALIILLKTLNPLNDRIKFDSSPQAIKQVLEEAINYHFDNIEHIITIRKNSKFSCMVAKKEGGQAHRVTSSAVARDATKVLCRHLERFLPANLDLNKTPTVSENVLNIYSEFLEEKASKVRAQAEKTGKQTHTRKFRPSVNLAQPLKNEQPEDTPHDEDEFES